MSPPIADVVALLGSQPDRLHHSVPPPSRLRSPGCPAPVTFGNCRKFWTGETILDVEAEQVAEGEEGDGPRQAPRRDPGPASPCGGADGEGHREAQEHHEEDGGP